MANKLILFFSTKVTPFLSTIKKIIHFIYSSPSFYHHSLCSVLFFHFSLFFHRRNRIFTLVKKFFMNLLNWRIYERLMSDKRNKICTLKIFMEEENKVIRYLNYSIYKFKNGTHSLKVTQFIPIFNPYLSQYKQTLYHTHE